MPRTVTASEAKNRFGAIVSWALEAKDEVIVESHGVPKVAIMPFEEYERMLAWREKERRKQAVAEIEALAERVRTRNLDLTEEQALTLADRFVRETLDNMVTEGKIIYGE